VTTAQKHPGLTTYTAIGGRGTAARIRAVGERLSERIHAAADDRAREVIQTPGRLGLSGCSYRDPRFAARRRTLHDPPARTDERHE